MVITQFTAAPGRVRSSIIHFTFVATKTRRKPDRQVWLHLARAMKQHSQLPSIGLRRKSRD
ncbi:hypothetical protein WG66_002768 [Moniliophthora roreri]|nr:hypothetical protein WG66_002768 [Moniliophthora roreri]